MSTFIRSALVALALVGTVSAASALDNSNNSSGVKPYQDVAKFWESFTKSR